MVTPNFPIYIFLDIPRRYEYPIHKLAEKITKKNSSVYVKILELSKNPKYEDHMHIENYKRFEKDRYITDPHIQIFTVNQLLTYEIEEIMRSQPHYDDENTIIFVPHLVLTTVVDTLMQDQSENLPSNFTVVSVNTHMGDIIDDYYMGNSERYGYTDLRSDLRWVLTKNYEAYGNGSNVIRFPIIIPFNKDMLSNFYYHGTNFNAYRDDIGKVMSSSHPQVKMLQKDFMEKDAYWLHEMIDIYGLGGKINE